MCRIVPILILAALAAGCASGGRPGPAAPAPTQADRGERFAWRACAGCHAVGATGESRNGGAPPFRDLAIRYNAVSLERRLAEISRNGHYEMPPVFITVDESRDVAAYIEQLAAR